MLPRRLNRIRYADEHPLRNNPPEVYNGFFARGHVLEEGSDAERRVGLAHAASFGANESL